MGQALMQLHLTSQVKSELGSTNSRKSQTLTTMNTNSQSRLILLRGDFSFAVAGVRRWRVHLPVRDKLAYSSLLPRDMESAPCSLFCSLDVVLGLSERSDNEICRLQGLGTTEKVARVTMPQDKDAIHTGVRGPQVRSSTASSCQLRSCRRGCVRVQRCIVAATQSISRRSASRTDR